MKLVKKIKNYFFPLKQIVPPSKKKFSEIIKEQRKDAKYNAFLQSRGKIIFLERHDKRKK